MRTRFQQGLDDLRTRLLRMGGLAEQAVDRACQAYIDRDLTRCHLVLEGESQINLIEREIDELAFDLLAMQQPMAVDLRFILAVTKINSDLERVGDQAVNIAERVMDMVELPKVELPVDIARMAAAASAMVRRSLESFIEGKAELAQAVLEMDNVVDRMKDEAFITLVKSMNERPETTRQALDALLIARNLERVADHATNIAEDVIFWVRGADVRHNISPEQRRGSAAGSGNGYALRVGEAAAAAAHSNRIFHGTARRETQPFETDLAIPSDSLSIISDEAFPCVKSSSSFILLCCRDALSAAAGLNRLRQIPLAHEQESDWAIAGRSGNA